MSRKQTVDVWLRVVDYDDEGIILRGADDTEAWFTFEEARVLPDRGELARFRVGYDAFQAKGLRFREAPQLTPPETDAAFRNRLLLLLGEEHVTQARRGEPIDAVEWDATLIATGTDLDKLAGIRGLIRRGGKGTPTLWKA